MRKTQIEKNPQKQPERTGPFVAYYRVSTKKQSLGLDAQKTIVKNYLKNHWPPIKSFTEKESGKKASRPELMKALNYCFENECILVVAQLDRLSRDLYFLTSIEKSGIDFVCCDYPNMDKLQLHIMGSIAQWEREQISKRTSRALQELKAKGKKLGAHNPKVLSGLKKLWTQKRKAKAERETQIKKDQTVATVQPAETLSKMAQDDALVLPTIKTFRVQKMTYKQIAKALNKAGVPTRRGGKWTAVQANRIALRNKIK